MKYKGFGLGCGSISSANETLELESTAIIQSAFKHDVTMLNTADFYGAGDSELGIGHALKKSGLLEGSNRDKVYISLKFGMLTAPNGMFYGMDVHPKRVKNYLTHSLKRLKVDYIDLYQPARIDPLIPVEETIGAIVDLVKEGYVRDIGLSQVDSETLRKAHGVHPISYVEMEYSLFNRKMEQEVLPTARELGIGTVAFGILAHGLMGGKWTKERVDRGELPRSQWIELFQRGNIEKNIILVERLLGIAKEKQVSLPELIYSWAMSKGQDIIPLIGASKVSQFENSILAKDLILTTDDVARIETAIPASEIAGKCYPQ